MDLNTAYLIALIVFLSVASLHGFNNKGFYRASGVAMVCLFCLIPIALLSN